MKDLSWTESRERWFSFEVLLLASDNMRHSKSKTMTMRGDQNMKGLELAVMALNQRPDIPLTEC